MCDFVRCSQIDLPVPDFVFFFVFCFWFQVLFAREEMCVQMFDYLCKRTQPSFFNFIHSISLNLKIIFFLFGFAVRMCHQPEMPYHFAVETISISSWKGNFLLDVNELQVCWAVIHHSVGTDIWFAFKVCRISDSLVHFDRKVFGSLWKEMGRPKTKKIRIPNCKCI